MCGLCGYLYINGKAEMNTECIRGMMALQKHRGPDDSGIGTYAFSKEVFEHPSYLNTLSLKEPSELIFGFNRLSIMDLSINGHQPMMEESAGVMLMMNGEVYNAFEYKAELEAKGHHFRSSSDTEIVLKLYLEYGFEKMIAMLNGMFAIVLFDHRLKTVFLARDRFGIKPLYILKTAERIAFSSELKSFRAMHDFHPELDESGIDEYLLFRNTVNGTLFKGIRNLEPGTFITINADGSQSTHVFYDVNQDGSQPLQSDNWMEELDELLALSVKRQMMSDVKLGAQLSGGVDSSLVSYYASKETPAGQLETISIIFDDPAYTEESYINQAAGKLRLQAHKYTMDAAYYLSQIENATWHFEQPVNHPNTLGIYFLSEEAKKHVTVLLSGEGADETFAGYDRFLTTVANPFMGKHFLKSLYGYKNDPLFFLNYYKSPGGRAVMGSSFGKSSLLSTIRPEFDINRACSSRNQTYKNLEGDNNLRQRKYEILTYLPDLLMRQDKMSMAHSIENRVPFLDNDLVSFALKLSGKDLILKKAGMYEMKVPLKEICARYFDEDFAYRQKKGFGIPLRRFFSDKQFQDYIWHTVFPGIKQKGLFKTAQLESTLQQINQVHPVQLDTLWMMISFEVWYQKYIGK